MKLNNTQKKILKFCRKGKTTMELLKEFDYSYHYIMHNLSLLKRLGHLEKHGRVYVIAADMSARPAKQA